MNGATLHTGKAQLASNNSAFQDNEVCQDRLKVATRHGRTA